MQQGSCHCGRIRFEVDGEPGDVIECNCSHCSRKGYLLWFVARDALRLAPDCGSLSTYRFNRHIIDHHFCPVCGCAPFGFGADPAGNAMAAVNVRCLEGVELSTLPRTQVNGREF
jgi:hypothetical protein